MTLADFGYPVYVFACLFFLLLFFLFVVVCSERLYLLFKFFYFERTERVITEAHCAHWIRRYRSRFYCSKCVCCIRLLTLLLCQDFFVFYWFCCCWNDGMIFWKLKQTDFVKMYKDKEVNNNVKDIFVNVWHKSVFDIYFRS